MYKVFIAFCSGLYIGTYYDCKPIIELAMKKAKEQFPEKN